MVEGLRYLATSSLILSLSFPRLNPHHEYLSKIYHQTVINILKKDGLKTGSTPHRTRPNSVTLKGSEHITVHHGVSEMPKTKKARKEGLEKHKQLQREKKQKTKERKNPSLPVKKKSR